MRTLVAIGTPAVTFGLMLLVGLDLAPGDFSSLLRRRRVLLAGLLAPPLLLPVLALGLIALVAPPPEVEVGLLLVAASPIGGISTAYSYLARAAVALSVSLTAFSCLLAPLTLPAIAAGLESASDRTLGFEAPFAVLALQVLILLALPVGIGMTLHSFRPAAVLRMRARLQRLAFAAVALLVVLVLAADPSGFVSRLRTTAPLAALFVLGSFATGGLVGRFATRDAGERFTLAAEFATRNLGVAVAVAVTFLGNLAFTYFATTYFLIEVALLLVAIVWRRAGGGRS